LVRLSRGHPVEQRPRRRPRPRPRQAAHAHRSRQALTVRRRGTAEAAVRDSAVPAVRRRVRILALPGGNGCSLRFASEQVSGANAVESDVPSGGNDPVPGLCHDGDLLCRRDGGNRSDYKVGMVTERADAWRAAGRPQTGRLDDISPVPRVMKTATVAVFRPVGLQRQRSGTGRHLDSEGVSGSWVSLVNEPNRTSCGPECVGSG
jgi:hypothetical protein